jgi:hypothetical protein
MKIFLGFWPKFIVFMGKLMPPWALVLGLALADDRLEQTTHSAYITRQGWENICRKSVDINKLNNVSSNIFQNML